MSPTRRARGATIATACSGAILLAEAGLLDGQEATTHWAYGDILQKRTTDEPVEAIAEDVGYEDAGFFGRLFRRRVGITPAQYRKRFRGMHRALGGR